MTTGKLESGKEQRTFQAGDEVWARGKVSNPNWAEGYVLVVFDNYKGGIALPSRDVFASPANEQAGQFIGHRLVQLTCNHEQKTDTVLCERAFVLAFQAKWKSNAKAREGAK